MGNGREEITFVIEEEIAVLSKTSSTGWTKELNLVSWDGNPAKYDIRMWDPAHERMSKGVTLTEEEAEIMVNELKAFWA